MREISYWNDKGRKEFLAHLVGKRVVAVEGEDTLVLSDGTRAVFQKENASCCSFIELTNLATTEAVITAARFEGDANKGEYKAALHVITEAGELNIAEADGNASNGYYLHGFALDVTLVDTDERA